MATIHEQSILIKLSKLARNNEALESTLIAPDVLQTLEQVVQELVGAESGVIVELEVEN